MLSSANGEMIHVLGIIILYPDQQIIQIAILNLLFLLFWFSHHYKDNSLADNPFVFWKWNSICHSNLLFVIFYLFNKYFSNIYFSESNGRPRGGRKIRTLLFQITFIHTRTRGKSNSVENKTNGDHSSSLKKSHGINNINNNLEHTSEFSIQYFQIQKRNQKEGEHCVNMFNNGIVMKY